MTTFIKTRAAADYICCHGPGELARRRAATLLAQLATCEAALASSNGDRPVFVQDLLRGLVFIVRELAGPAWLAARADDPDIAAFTALETTAGPPAPGVLDQALSRVLWARFAPAKPGPEEARSPGPSRLSAGGLCGRPVRRAGQARSALPNKVA